MKSDAIHLDAERLQALLDGSLPHGEAEAAEAHVLTCARCRSEMDAWRVLFEELDGLPDLAPSRGFADRVMDALPVPGPEPVGLAARVRSRMQGLAGTAGGSRAGAAPHVAPHRLQDLLEGMLAAPAAARVEAHLDGCRFCRDEAAALRKVMVGLNALPRFAPSPALAERVMAHVRVHHAAALARPTTRERLAALVGQISPRTRKRAAALAGALVTPAATLALVVYTVFSHPLVTVGSLASFLWLEGQDLLARLGGALLGSGPAERWVESVALFRAWSLVDTATRSPAAAAAAFAMMGGLTLVALWVLYRNLFATEHVDGRHAPYSY